MSVTWTVCSNFCTSFLAKKRSAGIVPLIADNACATLPFPVCIPGHQRSGDRRPPGQQQSHKQRDGNHAADEQRTNDG